jgi:long-chain acyl-CoA synthetase
MEVHDPIMFIVKGGPANRSPGAIGTVGDCVAEKPANDPHLGRLFEAVAGNRRAAPAVMAKSVCWSYTDLLSAARAVAGNLETICGFHPGDRVLVLLPNSAEYIAGFYGVLLAGGIVVPIPPKTEAGLLRAIIDSTEATVIVTDPHIAKVRTDLPLRIQNVVDLSDVGPVPTLRAASAPEFTGSELAAIFFTGGSTGKPKGVMLSHRNLSSNASSIRQYLQITPAERPLCILPFHHAFGNSVWQSHLLAGANVVIDGQPSFPETLIEALVRHACTSLSGVPDLFRLLIERSSLGLTALPRLRYMAVAGGALPHDLSLEMARRLAPAEFYVMYGQTEGTARLAYLPPENLERLSRGCIGQAIPGVTLEIVDAHARPVAPGVVGELRAAGDNVMLGYWKDPVATSDRIRSGWLHTGDLASCDGAGWITLHGRSSTFVKIAGFRVQPADLEDFAVRRLAATQAVVVPCDLPDLGTRLVLYVRLDASACILTLSEMVARCRAELPRHMVPEVIQLVNEFPLNSAMKIDRPLLQQWAEKVRNDSRRTLA